MIICAEEVADKLKIPNHKRVYPLASSETNHMIATLQRPNLVEPYGMKLAAEFILDICRFSFMIKPNIVKNLLLSVLFVLMYGSLKFIDESKSNSLELSLFRSPFNLILKYFL
mgnify:CR=1 FL=1